MTRSIDDLAADVRLGIQKYPLAEQIHEANVSLDELVARAKQAEDESRFLRKQVKGLQCEECTCKSECGALVAPLCGLRARQAEARCATLEAALRQIAQAENYNREDTKAQQVARAALEEART